MRFLPVVRSGGKKPLPLLRLLAAADPLSGGDEGVTAAPISFAASEGLRVFGFVPVRLAFCTRAADVGEGGLGGGFMAWACARGIVLILADDVTGAAIHTSASTRNPGRCSSPE